MLEKGADLHGHFWKAILGVGAHIALCCSSALEGKKCLFRENLAQECSGQLHSSCLGCHHDFALS